MFGGGEGIDIPSRAAARACREIDMMTLPPFRLEAENKQDETK